MARILVAGTVMLASLVQSVSTAQAHDLEPGAPSAAFEFGGGFAELRDQLGVAVVGFPLEPERQVADRDAVQLTTKGLMAWQKGGLPEFHDGVQTYVLEPEQRVASTPVDSRLERLVECVIQRESRGNPNAVNRSSGASGLGQFLGSTWRTTPQGRAGLSVFDPVANRNAVRWMISVGRGREFVTIGGC